MYYRSVDVDPRTRCLNADGLDQFICLIASRNGSEQRRTRGRGALSQEGHVGRQAARLVKSSRGGYFRYKQATSAWSDEHEHSSRGLVSLDGFVGCSDLAKREPRRYRNVKRSINCGGS